MNTPSDRGPGELLPCPFCMATAYISGDHMHSYCACTHCGCEGPYGDMTEAEAIAAWNRRPTPPTQEMGTNEGE